VITGVVNDGLEATIRLTLHGSLARKDVDAIVDTGFDGYLTLPPALIAALGFAWRCRTGGILADGGERVFDIHEGTVIWDGRLRRIAIDAAATITPLAVMGLRQDASCGVTLGELLHGHGAHAGKSRPLLYLAIERNEHAPKFSRRCGHDRVHSSERRYAGQLCGVVRPPPVELRELQVAQRE